MDFYELDLDEAIIIQASNVSRDGYDESEFEDEYLQEILLTNKKIMYVVAQEDGAEGEDCDIITVPLSAVKVIGGQVQVKQLVHDLYGLCLQIQFVHGVEYWRFGVKAKQQIPVWINKITDAVQSLPAASEYGAIQHPADAVINIPSAAKANNKSTCFCANCGAQISKSAKFCPECGEKVEPNSPPPSAQPDVVYDGRIHKCKNCGEVLKAFETVCPSCGYELRDVYASATIRAFAEKMEQLQSTGKYSDKNNIISLIRTFPIPNTKEDLFEFIILAGSNIREDRYSSELPKYKKEISDAWSAKFEQAYQKAIIAFPNDPGVQHFKAFYKSKKNEVRRRKLRRSLVSIALALLGLTLVIVGIALQSANEGSSWAMLSMIGLAMLCLVPGSILGS